MGSDIPDETVTCVCMPEVVKTHVFQMRLLTKRHPYTLNFLSRLARLLRRGRDTGCRFFRSLKREVDRRGT